MVQPTGKEPTDPYSIPTQGNAYIPYEHHEDSTPAPFTTLGQPVADAPEFQDNSEERCAIVLVLDTSNSMEGQPITLLNKAVQRFRSNLLEDPLIAAKVDIGTVVFDHTVQLQDFVNATQYNPAEMQPGGGTNLSFAMNVAMDMVAKRKDTYRINGISYHRPWIVLLTDGLPEHDSESAIKELSKRIKTANDNREFALFTITCGEANHTAGDFLRENITPPGRPPKKTEDVNFSELFDWLSNSLIAVSQSSPSDEVPLEDTSGWETV